MPHAGLADQDQRAPRQKAASSFTHALDQRYTLKSIKANIYKACGAGLVHRNLAMMPGQLLINRLEQQLQQLARNVGAEGLALSRPVAAPTEKPRVLALPSARTTQSDTASGAERQHLRTSTWHVPSRFRRSTGARPIETTGRPGKTCDHCTVKRLTCGPRPGAFRQSENPGLRSRAQTGSWPACG